ncbi:rhodanese-like domain-containing protein [Roseofilum sp. BLCC_M91]|uniref:Rhodanese-like domain-containing protein n=1 Tax=Roseofilum halophilum BLCC-M91 TaxID=3022259 RepID=A0ABT7BK14_9CYAN|nr:rhodanese-like domain-containing protein [Roseofilum halophilum]MDJ1179532.1 rhodanese-like domain-containing protein [Roseofilum halophilum BLCC-M91]
MASHQNLQDKLQAIDSFSVKELWEQDRIQFIDVREPSEYAGERIPGAISRPLSRFNPDDVLPDPTKPFILYCQTGNRSATAAQKLFLAGFEEVAHLGGGLEEWKQQGYPTHVNPKAPISIMRQVQIVAGSLVLTGTLLGAFVAPGFLFLSGFVGAGLMFAGISNTCMMAQLLAKLPYNQRG